MRYARLGYRRTAGGWWEALPAHEARALGPEVEWRAVLIAANGEAWEEHGMGWDVLALGQTEMVDEMAEAEFMAEFADLLLPDWLLRRL